MPADADARLEGAAVSPTIESWWLEKEMAGQQKLGIVQVTRSGIPVHLAHHHESDEEAEAHEGFMRRGIDGLGAVGFSIMRTEQTKQDRRDRRLELLLSEWHQLDREQAVASDRGFDLQGGFRRKERNLLVWEAMGFCSEVCENLAAAVECYAEHLKTSVDFGDAFMKWEAPAYRTFASAPFTDLDWWKQRLWLDPASAASAQATLPTELWLTYAALADETASHVERVTKRISAVYDQQFHRVAQRRKHAGTYVDYLHGLIWYPGNPTRRKVVREMFDDGAFAVLDRDHQLVVPGDERAFDLVTSLAEDAMWLYGALVVGILGVEAPSGRGWVAPPRGDEPRPEYDTLTTMLELLTGGGLGKMPEQIRARAAESRFARLQARQPPVRPSELAPAIPRTGRNEPCPCGSGSKYKRCHGR